MGALSQGKTPNQIAKSLKKDLAYVTLAMGRIKEALT